MATITYTDYAAWFSALDTLMWHRHGLSVDDVEDYCWSDLFEDGLTPAEAFTSWREDRD